MFQYKVRPCFDRRELIGNFIPYLIVDDAVIVDPKVVSCFTDRHIAQMIRYLNITRLNLALLINSRMRAWNGNECCVRKNLTPNTFGAATLSFIPRPIFSSI